MKNSTRNSDMPWWVYVSLTLVFFLVMCLLFLYIDNVYAQTQKYTIQCQMFLGCSYHPDGGYPADFMMWAPWLSKLASYQYDGVVNVSEWLWILE